MQPHVQEATSPHPTENSLNDSLSKIGYSSKTSRAVVFGPHRYLGIGLRHLYPNQGIGQTLQLLKHVCSASTGAHHQGGSDQLQEIHRRPMASKDPQLHLN
jgi:hypothetical protein